MKKFLALMALTFATALSALAIVPAVSSAAVTEGTVRLGLVGWDGENDMQARVDFIKAGNPGRNYSYRWVGASTYGRNLSNGSQQTQVRCQRAQFYESVAGAPAYNGQAVASPNIDYIVYMYGGYFVASGNTNYQDGQTEYNSTAGQYTIPGSFWTC